MTKRDFVGSVGAGVLLGLALLFLAACDEALPTVPSHTSVTVNQTVNVGTPLPNATPSPGTPTANTITSVKVTEIGGDGLKEYSVGELIPLTATPFNSAGVDPCAGLPSLATCAAYQESDVQWFAVAGVGVGLTVEDLGAGETLYNRSFRAKKVGTFSVRATVKGIAGEFTGTVTSASSSSYRAGGSGGGFGTDPVRP